jgi:hypothetical protein
MTAIGVGESIPELRVVMTLLARGDHGGKLCLCVQQMPHITSMISVSLIDVLDDVANGGRENTDKLFGIHGWLLFHVK